MTKNNIKKTLRKFICDFFGSKIFSYPVIYRLKIFAYKKAFNIGNNPIINNNVIFSTSHGLKGEINIGNNVILGKDIFIDYSGGIEIGDNVAISNRTIIYTHLHKNVIKKDKRYYDKVSSTKLNIEKNVIIYSNSIIMPSVKYIGKNSIILAGAIVTKDVPDNVVVGNNVATKKRMSCQ